MGVDVHSPASVRWQTRSMRELSARPARRQAGEGAARDRADGDRGGRRADLASLARWEGEGGAVPMLEFPGPPSPPDVSEPSLSSQ